MFLGFTHENVCYIWRLTQYSAIQSSVVHTTSFVTQYTPQELWWDMLFEEATELEELARKMRLTKIVDLTST